MRTLYDSIRADGMPPDGNMYACYTDGLYSNEAAVRAAFPGKPIVRISAIGKADADVIDVEPGCVWPPSAAAPWLAARPNAVIYCGLANLATVVAALGTNHSYWVAHYTNTPHQCSQARCGYSTAGARIVGTQYGGDSNAGGYHFDVSAIYDDTWLADGVSAAAQGATPINVQEDDDMDQAVVDAITDGQRRAASADEGVKALTKHLDDLDGPIRDAFNNAAWANAKLDGLMAALAALPAGTGLTSDQLAQLAAAAEKGAQDAVSKLTLTAAQPKEQ